MDSNKIEKLKALSKLYKTGILTKEELEIEKQKVLSVDLSDESSNENKKDFKPLISNLDNPDISSKKEIKERPHRKSDNRLNCCIHTRKKIIYLLITLFILIGIGVFIGLYQHRQNQIAYAKEREQARLDSIAEIERLIEIHRQDSIRKETEIKNFTSPDIALFGLHGRVKKLKITHGIENYPFPFIADIVDFSYDGKLKSQNVYTVFLKNYFDVVTEKVDIKTNTEGFIIYLSVLNNPGMGNVKLKWNNGFLQSFEGGGDFDYEFEGKYLYKNEKLSEFEISYSGLSFVSRDKTRYSDFQFDTYGNWIKCSYNKTGTNKEYDEILTDDGEYEDILVKDEKIGPQTGYIIREIEYYN